MEASRQIQVMVPPLHQAQPQYRHDQQAQASSLQYGRVKNLSVGQALQYTPLITSVLPAHDRVPIPQIIRARESARLTSSTERKTAQNAFSQYPANRLKERLQGLLKPELLPEYKFKRSPSTQTHTQASGKVSEQLELSLTPNARTILEMTSVDYKCMLEKKKRFMTVTDREADPPRNRMILENRKLSKGEIARPISTSDKQKTSQSRPRLHDGVLPGPNGQMPSISKPLPRPISINLPKPSGDHHSATININPESTRISGSSEGDPTIQTSIHIRSQREDAEAALQQFQNSLLELFEAQDQLDAGSTTVYEAGFFQSVDEGDDSEPMLSVKVMDRLLIGLKKLVGMKIITDLSSEHLRRLQQLCEPLIDRTQTIDLTVHSDADVDEQQRWRYNIRKAGSGLLSASVFLYTTLGSPPDESLISSEALIWIPSALRNVFENCLIPSIEARSDDSTSDLFKMVTSYKDDVKRLLEISRKVLDLVSTACTQIRGLEHIVNPIEFLAAKLIFVQNATMDKNSALGIQTFEKVRKTAMSSLARVFARFPAERSAILDEVLTSLDKLPSNSRSARHYRLVEGKNIQLISALFMQLVQNTALEHPENQLKLKRNVTGHKLDDIGNEDGNGAEIGELVQEQDEDDHDNALMKLQQKGDKLFDVAARSAQEIVLYLVGRASKTTKTGDSPYRNVLDLFIEDMVTVLSLPEWPASELMLRIMAAKMTDMAQHEKTALAKNMALECLGTMGSAISTLKASLPRQCAALFREGRTQSAIAEHLARLAADHDQGAVRNEDLIAFNGPFAIVSRHLWTNADQGLRNLSACGFFLAQYAKVMSLVADINNFDESDIEAEPVRVANFLLNCIAQIGSGSTTMHSFDAVLPEEAELAYTLSVLNMGFCRRFSVIVKTLSSSFSSDQAMVRSRSLKSVVAMLETDSTLLDRDPTIADDIFRCASDDSAMVRDSALSLIAKFIIAKPALEQKGIQRLLECASDAKVGVQKRAIGHLKEIYLKDDRALLKATISRVILKRTMDHEDTVAELSKKTLGDIWISPVLTQLVQSADLAKTKVAIEELANDIVTCISYDPTTLCPLLRKFLKSTLSGEAKSISKSRDLFEKVVEVLFEKTISNQDEKGPLMVLTSFAEADPQLIRPSNLGKLQPYLGNLKSESDLFVFKAVISIFGCVLPHLSATHKPLLQETQNALMKAISFLGRRNELDTVMSCLQVIDGVLQNTMRLIKLAGSIMLKIKSSVATLVNSREVVPQLLKLLRIAGAMGRYIDLEQYWQQFANEVKDMKGRSVAGYMANTLLPLTLANQPLKVRLLALESLGSLCQASPSQFNQKPIRDTFFFVLKAETNASNSTDIATLQGVVLKVFDELYAQRAKDKEGDESLEEDKEKQELGKLGGDSKTRDGDSAISMITGELAKSAFAIALTTPSDNAFLAAKIMASISHQGLNHPKHSLLAFVALSTCPDTRIAEVAHDAHKLLHQQHESVCEREYMTAVHEAFEYQQKALNDPSGARQPSYQAKLALCFEVVVTSGSKYVKKFLSGMVSRISAKLSSEDGSIPIDQVMWTLFAVQNLAFFDYSKADEVLHTILQLELAYSKKGVEISQLLEAALARPPGLEDLTDIQLFGEGPVAEADSQALLIGDMSTVQRLAPLAATLTIMMEGRSYLKRQYGVGRDVRTAISNSKQAKDTAKPPVRVHGITGEKFWTKSNAVVTQLKDEADVVSCCRNFVALMRMDDEVTVEDDDPFHEPSESIAPPEVCGYVRGTTPGGVKRKLSASASSTPAKRGPGQPKKEARRSASVSSVDDLDADFHT